MTLRRFYVLTAPFVSRLGRSEKYISQDILQPEEVEAVTPPWISQSSYERISRAHPWADFETERAVLGSRETTHAPVVRFVHGPGIVGPDGFSTRHRRLRLSPNFTLNALTRKTSRAATVTYINNTAITQYFGHWITDGVPQTDLAQDGSYYLTNPQTWLHCKEYRQALGLGTSDENYISADEIITYSDFSQGSLKRQRYASLKKRLAKAFPTRGTAEKVFLWRGDTGTARRFRDADKLRQWLEADGWRIVDVTASLADIFPALAGARVVAAMEGSHLNHAHFCTRPGTAIAILVPHDIFATVQVGLVRAVGNFCGFYVLPGDQATGYHLDFDAFTETVEQTFAVADRAV
jgi:hypothetical protein